MHPRPCLCLCQELAVRDAARAERDGRHHLVKPNMPTDMRDVRTTKRSGARLALTRRAALLFVVSTSALLHSCVAATGVGMSGGRSMRWNVEQDADVGDAEAVGESVRELSWLAGSADNSAASGAWSVGSGVHEQYPTHGYNGNNHYKDSDADESDDSGTSYAAKRNIAICSVGGAFILVAMCLTWRAFVECCTSSSRRPRHRAFISRSLSGWSCEVCYHMNESAQTSCVLCGTPTDASKVPTADQRTTEASVSLSSSIQAEEASMDSSNYMLLSSPRAGLRRALYAHSSEELNDRQLVARERHEWKRCIGDQKMRWVNLSSATFQESEALRSTIVLERDLRIWRVNHRKTPSQHPASSSQVSGDSSMMFSDSSRQPLFWLTPSTAFVRDDSHPGPALWRLAEEVVICSREHSKTILRVSKLTFSEKAQWLYQFSLKLCSSIVDGFHTIRIRREHVLKQSVSLLMAAPSSTLHRRLRVDFAEEPGVDGGGILREWLHLVCSELFAETLGLFEQTNSSTHQGYWINRKATKTCRNRLQLFTFFGKLLGKALLEGLLLNVRLSVPLLKHLLGTPFKVSDLHLLDETVYSSLMWILENDNTNSLGLNFTVEGKELIPNGEDVALHDGNKHLYVAKVVQYYLFDSVHMEIASILEGLRSIMSDTTLHVFDFKELDLLLSGLPSIDVDDWRANTDVRLLDQNVDHELELINWFWEIVESFSQDQRGRLLQYVTGSSGVPVEGFKGLAGMDGDIQPFTIQLGKAVSQIYTVLPHSSTCLNRLDLPVYSTKKELEDILLMVIEMDVTGFNSR